MNKEQRTLLDTLEQQRRHVLGILDGLSDDQLRLPILPSGWSCLGMLKHLARDDEHYWFRCIVAGESFDFFGASGEEHLNAWEVPSSEPAEHAFSLYREEIARANDIIARIPPDAAPAQRDAWWPADAFPDMRTIMLHMIAETACHAGHLDAARELIDGRQWLIQPA